MANRMQECELATWLRLVLTPSVGNGAARRLLAAWGSPEAVFEQDVAALERVVTPRQARALASLPERFDEQLRATLGWLLAEETGISRRIVTLGDTAYPPGLLAMEDPPLLLYVQGRWASGAAAAGPWPARAIGIVGSRSPTPQGVEDAGRFARFLSAAGCCVVSGLALGVDGAAHAGALEGAVLGDAPATIAVIGTGIDRVYPARHRALAHRIAERGLIVSEYPLGTAPLAANFPKRNRLIAGLSQGVLVVEAALRSGSLITARVAAEQGKEVFAIPGSIHNPLARGCHALIREGAKLVETGADVLEELRWAAAEVGAVTEMTSANYNNDVSPSAQERGVLLRALGTDPASLDALQARTGMETALLQARLLELELDGRIGRLPGGLFQRLVRG